MNNMNELNQIIENNELYISSNEIQAIGFKIDETISLINQWEKVDRTLKNEVISILESVNLNLWKLGELV